jgi:saccharopine dehydrogenase (NAD+, L-lysine-forming)
MMMFKGAWAGKGVLNVEQLPPEPFLKELGPQGLPWHVRELKAPEQGDLFAVKT